MSTINSTMNDQPPGGSHPPPPAPPPGLAPQTATSSSNALVPSPSPNGQSPARPSSSIDTTTSNFPPTIDDLIEAYIRDRKLSLLHDLWNRFDLRHSNDGGLDVKGFTALLEKAQKETDEFISFLRLVFKKELIFRADGAVGEVLLGTPQGYKFVVPLRPVPSIEGHGMGTVGSANGGGQGGGVGVIGGGQGTAISNAGVVDGKKENTPTLPFQSLPSKLTETTKKAPPPGLTLVPSQLPAKPLHTPLTSSFSKPTLPSASIPKSPAPIAPWSIPSPVAGEFTAALAPKPAGGPAAFPSLAPPPSTLNRTFAQPSRKGKKKSYGRSRQVKKNAGKGLEELDKGEEGEDEGENDADGEEKGKNDEKNGLKEENKKADNIDQDTTGDKESPVTPSTKDDTSAVNSPSKPSSTTPSEYTTAASAPTSTATSPTRARRTLRGLTPAPSNIKDSIVSQYSIIPVEPNTEDSDVSHTDIDEEQRNKRVAEKRLQALQDVPELFVNPKKGFDYGSFGKQKAKKGREAKGKKRKDGEREVKEGMERVKEESGGL